MLPPPGANQPLLAPKQPPPRMTARPQLTLQNLAVRGGGGGFSPCAPIEPAPGASAGDKRKHDGGSSSAVVSDAVSEAASVLLQMAQTPLA